MNYTRQVLVITGLILLFVSLFSIQNPQSCEAWMYRVDRTPYYLIILGILLIFLPFLGSLFSKKSKKKKFESSPIAIEKNNSENHIIDKTKETIDERLILATKLLSEDESSILKIIHENEGITQDSIHFRTGFSHSKISMIMKKLEEKDLIVRERFGKTYKVYLGEWFADKFEGD